MNIIEAEIAAQQKRLAEARANKERYAREINNIQVYVETWNDEIMKAAIVVDLLLEKQRRQKERSV